MVWVWSQKAREAATMAAAAEATREDADAATRVTVRSLAILTGMASLTRGLQALGHLVTGGDEVSKPVAQPEAQVPPATVVALAMEMSLVTAQEMYFTLLSKVRV